MTLPAPSASAAQARLHAAAGQLERLVLKELVRASRAFTGGEGAGSAIRADLFADALADALVRGGGLGLTRSIEHGLDPAATPVGGVRPTPPRGPASVPGSGGAHHAVTSAFGLRHDPFDGRLTRHEGVDPRSAEVDGMPVDPPAPLGNKRSVPMGGSTPEPDPGRPP